jgi:hypothetical protein
MMSPGQAQPKQLDIQAYMTPQGHYDSKRHKSDQAIMERSKYHGMDPWEAIKAQDTDARMESGTASLREQYPHLSEAQARAMLAEYPTLWDGEKPKGGMKEDQKRNMLAKHWHARKPEQLADESNLAYARRTGFARSGGAPVARPSDPGDRIRDLMPGKLEPFIIQHMGPGMSKYVPNPEWGKQNGMIWDGEAWVTDDPRKSSAHDLDMEMKRLEMERLRQQMAIEQQIAEEELRAKRGSTGVAGGLRDWLNKRLGGG